MIARPGDGAKAAAAAAAAAAEAAVNAAFDSAADQSASDQEVQDRLARFEIGGGLHQRADALGRSTSARGPV